MDVDSSSDDDWVPYRDACKRQNIKGLVIHDEEFSHLAKLHIEYESDLLLDNQSNKNNGRQHSLVKNREIINFAKVKRAENRVTKDIEEKEDQPMDEKRNDDQSSSDNDDDINLQEIFDKSDLQARKQQIKSESLMFNPWEDEMNSDWIDKQFKSKSKTQHNDDEDEFEFPLSEITLTWPGWFTDVCYLCQPHEKNGKSNRNQYRAKEVYNVELATSGGNISLVQEILEQDNEVWLPVKCKICSNDLGFYDYSNRCYHLAV